MYRFFSDILSDKKGGAVFTCFGVWHALYMAVIFGVIIATVMLLSKKDADVKKKSADVTIGAAFGLYILDFFLMPFAYGEIDLEKLPFHACTAMCIMCFLSRRSGFLSRFKKEFALLGLISNLVYVIYPAGIMWYQIHPLSYRAVQTLLFHGLMTAYGVFVLAFDEVRLEWKTCYRDLAVIAGMAIWALLGNTLYNGTHGEYSHSFNWFFVIQDPFYLLPANIAPYIMPFVVIAAFFAVEILVYAIWNCLSKRMVKD